MSICYRIPCPSSIAALGRYGKPSGRKDSAGEIRTMIVAIPTAGKDLDSPIDNRFGRAVGFIIYDMNTGEYKHQVNNLDELALEGAGIQAARNLVRAGINAVITGHCGPRAFHIFSNAGVEIYSGIKGPASAAVRRLAQGGLTPVQAPDVEEHWPDQPNPD